jgi:RNA 3'-terminal phosphate cyclase (ATP)
LSPKTKDLPTIGRMTDMLELDGSIGEGGGQVLRVAVALSAILAKPLHIVNIRRKRSNPGLRPQHIAAVRSVAEACGAEVHGLSIGSTEIVFRPGPIRGGDLRLDTGTAGSTTLVLQSLLPVLAYAGKISSYQITGGTNNPMAPPAEYLQQVLRPILELMGLEWSIELIRRGFYPKGGGLVRGTVKPVRALKPLNLTGRPSIKKVDGLSYTCRLPKHISERMASTAEKLLAEHGLEASIQRECLTPGDAKCSLDPGAGLILYSVGDGYAIGVDRLGKIGMPAEEVAKETVAAFVNELSTGAPLDRHLGDMLVIWAALADGKSEYHVSSLTSHTLTSVEVCRNLLGVKIDVLGERDGRGLIRCDGLGFKHF